MLSASYFKRFSDDFIYVPLVLSFPRAIYSVICYCLEWECLIISSSCWGVNQALSSCDLCHKMAEPDLRDEL